jgi:colanic acid/amylovoran biosynthesis protein
LANAGFGTLYRAEVLDAFKNCDFVVSTSDENFKEGNLKLPFNIAWTVTWWSILFARTCEVFVAKKVFKKRVILFPNSVGPFRTFIGRLLAKIAFKNVDLMLLRDKVSVANLKSLGVKSPTMLTVDVAINFKANTKNNPVKLETPAIGVAAGVYFNALTENEIRNFVAAHAKALDFMVDKYKAKVVFLPHDVTGFKNDDYDMCKSVWQAMRHREEARMIHVQSVDEYKLILGQLDMLVSSKMHPAVLATSSNVPALYVVYDHKQTGFFEQLGLLDYCLDITAVSSDSLIRKMENLWNNRQKVKSLLSQRIPELQENVKNAIKKAVLIFQSG